MFLDLVKQARSHRGFRQDRKVTRQEREKDMNCFPNLVLFPDDRDMLNSSLSVALWVTTSSTARPMEQR